MRAIVPNTGREAAGGLATPGPPGSRGAAGLQVGDKETRALPPGGLWVLGHPDVPPAAFILHDDLL